MSACKTAKSGVSHTFGCLCLKAILLVVWLFGVVRASAEQPPPQVLLNADLTHTRTIGESLWLGFQAGLLVGSERYGGPAITIEARDHQKNLRRTKATVDEAAASENLVVLLGGKQTPHYLKHGLQINSDQIVLLLPWSAGASLTRLVDGEENHIFRLSVDDRNAAPFLASNVQRGGCARAAILAIDNGWGRSNAKAIKTQLDERGIQLVSEDLLRSDAGLETVSRTVRAMEAVEPDCVIFVLSGRGGALAANAMSSWEEPPTIYSHWGILGGEFDQFAEPFVWKSLDVLLLTTCVQNLETRRPNLVREALDAASHVRGETMTWDDTGASMAFVHAYDLALLLSTAVLQAQADPRWRGGRAARSAALRDALENLEMPVAGLLKDYHRPFGPVGPTTQNGHEALGADDLCLARLSKSGSHGTVVWSADQ